MGLFQVLFLGLATILTGFLLYARAWSIPELLEDYGEFLAILYGGYFLITQFRRENQRNAEQKQAEALEREDAELQKKRTARYWVFYNASNRVAQDIGVIREIYASQRDFDTSHADRDTEQKLLQYVKILEGFQETWKNDDVLNSALSFEFSLLTRPEKRAILDYFANYNEVEDRIQLKLPLLMPDRKADGGLARSMAVENEDELKELIESLYDELGGLVVEGIELMELLQHIDEFPGFAKRMDKYRDEAANKGEQGRGLSERGALPKALEPRAIKTILDQMDAAHREELDAEKAYIEARPYSVRRLEHLRKSTAEAVALKG